MNASGRLVCSIGLTIPSVLAAQQLDSAHAADRSAGSRPIAVTGYVTASFTASTRPKSDTIVGRLYGRRQNEFMLNVANVTLERLPATDRWEAGFHVEAWVGQNAAVVKSAGLDLGPDADVWQGYAVLNVPLAGASRYVQVKAGKMATLMGVEVGEDVLNPNLDAASQDVFLEPFTETGVELDGKFWSTADVEVRVSNGWDQVTDVNHGKSIAARLGLTPNDKTLIAVLGYAGPEQANDTRDDRTGAQLLASRKLTSATTTWLQLDYGREDGAAADGGQARWYAAGLWMTYDVASTATLALRGDYVNDRDGARTSGVLGFPANAGQRFGSATATLNIKRWEHALMRPELRYDRSTIGAYDGRSQQLSFSLGLSYIF